MTRKPLIYFTFCLLLGSCCNDDLLLPSPIPKHVDNDVALSKGINFKTKKQVILNPLTGEQIKPCPQKKLNKDDTNCIELVEPNPVIRDILENAQYPIPIKVKRDGKIIDDKAFAVVTIDVLYKGSHCEASFSAGTQTVNCSNLSVIVCNTYLPYRHRTGLNPTAQAIVNNCEAHFWDE